MDVIKKFEAAEKRKDINGMCELCTEEVHFQTPKWETKEQERPHCFHSFPFILKKHTKTMDVIKSGFFLLLFKLSSVYSKVEV